jgi:hypothetical protein
MVYESNPLVTAVKYALYRQVATVVKYAWMR